MLLISKKYACCSGKLSGLQLVNPIMLLTLTLASVRFVHMAISSLVDISGYRFLAKVASSSCSCCEVKCVRCLLCLLFFLSFFSPSSPPPPPPSSPPSPGVVDSVLMVVSEFRERFPANTWLITYFFGGFSTDI